MASKIEGQAKAIACSWNDIKGQIKTRARSFSLGSLITFELV